MNMPAENFSFVAPERTPQIVETVNTEAVGSPHAVMSSWKNNTLRNYESLMRQHAAACEAGRR